MSLEREAKGGWKGGANGRGSTRGRGGRWITEEKERLRIAICGVTVGLAKMVPE
jgi:hypothetical protein